MDTTVMADTKDASSSSKENARLEQSDSTTKDQIDYNKILFDGDLSRMHLIDEYIAAANRKPKCSALCEEIAHSFCLHAYPRSDVALVHALTLLRHFNLLANPIIRNLPLRWDDDSAYHAMLSDALLPHIGREHERTLYRKLLNGIKNQYPVSVLEFFDVLWSKSISNDSNHVQDVKDLYSESLDTQGKNVSALTIVKEIIHTGISRHMYALLDFIDETAHNDELDTYSKSKLLEWANDTHLEINTIPVLSNISSDKPLVWYKDRQFFTSQISTQTCQTLPYNTTEGSNMPRILRQMSICASSCQNDEKEGAISCLISEICKVMEDVDSGASYEPIITGSTAEYTQALFIDEFDYLLYTNSTSCITDYNQRLKTAILKIKETLYHPRLAIQSIELNTQVRYPCLSITWIDEELLNTRISIDLVLATALNKTVILPHHNFLPVPREQLVNGETYKQQESLDNCDRKIEDHGDRYINQSGNSPCLFIDEFGQTVFSPVENALIKTLPSYVIEGYRLAKAVCIVYVIQPIMKKLVVLGVTRDIHKVIRTYHLKTCVFYLTQNYICDDRESERNDRWNWAILVFEKLREFIILGNVREFFATDRYVFGAHYQECKHHYTDFTAELPRYRCCRIRKVRLLIVNQILRVLRDSQSKFHPKNKSFGNALSKAINASILRLI